MKEQYFKDLIQKWFETELSSVPDLKPTEEMYALLQKKVTKERSFFYRSRWFMAAAAMFLMIFMTITNFQQIFYPAPILELELQTRYDNEEKEEISFDRSFKMHAKKGLPSVEKDKIIFQFQREGSAFVTEVEMDPKHDQPLGLNSSDNYRLSLKVITTSYLYIFQINRENIPIKLFPGSNSDLQNPLEANEKYILPAEDKWYFLNDQTGEEQIFVCVSDKEILEFDELYSQYYKTRSASKKEKILNKLMNKLIEEGSKKILINNQ